MMNKNESSVNYYGKVFPICLVNSKDEYLFDNQGNKYLDFFSGAGSLNYGHNNLEMQKLLIDYINSDGIVNSLDFETPSRNEFINSLTDILKERQLTGYKIQFCGPTGTNSVESAVKLARKFTKRKLVLSFQGAFHGMTLGSMSVSGIEKIRNSIEIDLKENINLPYVEEGQSFKIEDIESLLINGLEPAAIIIELIQGEGGIKISNKEWVNELKRLSEKYGFLFIVDDIQMGCGRTGKFFSFEHYGINPDIICLSKSLSGFGLPLSINIIKDEFDVWDSGEHNGTFRGNNLAFKCGTKAFSYWSDEEFLKKIKENCSIISEFTQRINKKDFLNARALGVVCGIEFENSEIAKSVQKDIFEQNMIVETCGEDKVIKLLPPININPQSLIKGLSIIETAIMKNTKFSYESL